MGPTLPRRAVVIAGGATMLSLAGCLGDVGGSGGPQERVYTLTITGTDDALDARVEPAGEVADVVQVHVGDTVEFTVRNEADGPVGVHNHATDAELVVEPGGEDVLSFEATEAMTGRHELEGWPAEADDDGADDAGHGGHGAGATTLVYIEVRPQGS